MLAKINLEVGEINYFDSCNFEKPVIVFIHGNSHSHKVFAAQFESPFLKKYRLVAMDLPGHGQSSRTLEQEHYSLPYLGKLVASFCEKLNISRALFAGHSLGGHILLEAANFLPSAIGFFIWGTPPIKNISDMALAFQNNQAVSLLFKGTLSLEEVEIFAKACYSEDFEDWYASVELIKETDPFARESLGREVLKGHFSDEVVILSKLNHRLAIGNSEKDFFINSSYFSNLNLSIVYNKELIQFEGVGHSPHIEKSKFFNKFLDSFYKMMLN